MSDDRRMVRLVHETVERLSLDLRGLSVLTEAATGPFAATAAIAAVAGARRVVAIARDSVHGGVNEAETATRRLAKGCNVEQVVDVTRALRATNVGDCDVITNLGFVRPIDARLVSWLKPTAVVALMSEAWEFRMGDVDLDACRARGIVVLATNEHASSWPVFRYCGPLAVRMLFDAGFEVLGTRVTVLGGDPFTPVIVEALAGAGAIVRHHAQRMPAQMLNSMIDAEVIVIAEYSRDDLVFGDAAMVTGADVARVAPYATVVQFAGAIDTDSLIRHGIPVWPRPPVGAHRMSRTLAHLGPRPVVELHAAGLKVGALGARARHSGLLPSAAAADACRLSELAQVLPHVLEGSSACD